MDIHPGQMTTMQGFYQAVHPEDYCTQEFYHYVFHSIVCDACQVLQQSRLYRNSKHWILHVQSAFIMGIK